MEDVSVLTYGICLWKPIAKRTGQTKQLGHRAGLTIFAKLVDYWVASDYREGLRWSTEFIQNPTSQTFPRARARALMAQGWLLWSMQQFETISFIAEECLEVFRSYGDQIGEYDALILMGNMGGMPQI